MRFKREAPASTTRPVKAVFMNGKTAEGTRSERGKEMTKWDAGQYLKFQAERTQPARDLASKIPLQTVQKALDIGCGPGNSTRIVKERFPSASVLGIDQSPEMIRAARGANPDLTFQVFDITQELTPLGGEYDLIFSNACLQWVPEHEKLLPQLIGFLRPGGALAVQIPNNFQEPVHRILARLSSSEKWHTCFSSPRIFHQLAPAQYFDLLSEHTAEFTMWETTYYHRLPSHQAILEWYRGTGLRPYLACLADGERQAFEREVLTEIEYAYPAQRNGEIIFRFPRLFFIACK